LISLGQLPSCWADKQSLVGVEGSMFEIREVVNGW